MRDLVKSRTAHCRCEARARGSMSLALAKRRYEQLALNAHRQAGLNLSGVLGVEFHISTWTRKGMEAFGQQWEADAEFQWREIFRRHLNEPDRLEIVVWGPEGRLCALALATTGGSFIKLGFLEGDPRPDCPLKGRRALIALEATQCYGQGRGKSELRIQPANDDLATMYVENYGFSLETRKGVDAYYKREIV